MGQIGSKVKSLREQRGMTQKELAELVGVNQSFISDLEGNKKAPGTPTLMKLAEVFNVSIDWLLDGGR